MARNYASLLELDIEKLFEEHKITEIVEIEKLLDAEIERKRIELRSMVGDRYKDVLAASDAIKSMKTISQNIVDNIQEITDVCEKLIVDPGNDAVALDISASNQSSEERVLIIQIRLALFINEQIWIALDSSDNLTAAQFYLLAQHIHTGLSLTKREFLDKLPLLKQINTNLQTLRHQIFHRINQKLESVEITAEDTSSNLNALLLLQNQSTDELLNIFINHRKIALNTVIKSAYSSVRMQISAMVKCIITTIHLLHDCFMCYKDFKRGLILHQLETIVRDNSSPTLSKIDLPTTPLIAYIPDLIKDFRPKYKDSLSEPSKTKTALEDWLKSTKISVKSGLESSLKLITNIKGLHIIREEALKIDLPYNWDNICSETFLPENFNVWFYFFQSLMKSRACELISKKVALIVDETKRDIAEAFDCKNSKSETDLRWYSWIEDSDDVSRVENKHTGLSMKTLGFSQKVVDLCVRFDHKHLELLRDVSQYLYGHEFDQDLNLSLQASFGRDKKKFVDREELEKHLKLETVNRSVLLSMFLCDFVKSEKSRDVFIEKSLMGARFLQAITILCPHFKKCCTFNGDVEDWSQINNKFTKICLQFWEHWVDRSVEDTKRELELIFSDNTKGTSMISVLARWDVIEIQEQTEERVFKSHIKVPLKPSLTLSEILTKLNRDLSYILPHTLPKQTHLQFIERNVENILEQYKSLAGTSLNQNQSLQFLFDVKFLTTFSIPRENLTLIALSQEICDKFRGKIDPFDLDVFYAYLQSNVKRAVIQSQVILGCLLPTSGQLANLGISDKIKDQEKEPSILALSVPSTSSWFPLLPISVPSQRTVSVQPSAQNSKVMKPAKTTTPKKYQDPTAAMRSGAAALFGNLTTDWFS